MVCSKCQKIKPATCLATPQVKRKNEMYFGSAASKKDGKASATLGNNGVGKSKLLSKAKNPYAAYSSSCAGCQSRTDSGKKYCQRCAYRSNVCAVCGKKEKMKDAQVQPIVQGQKFSSK